MIDEAVIPVGAAVKADGFIGNFKTHSGSATVGTSSATTRWLTNKRLERARFASLPSGTLSDVELRLVLDVVDLSVREICAGARVRVA